MFHVEQYQVLNAKFRLAPRSIVPQSFPMQRWLPAILIVALLIGFRLLTAAFPETMPNFQPLLGIFLCGIVFLKGALRWAVPLLVWLVTDPITSIMQGYPVLGAHHLSILVGILPTIAIAFYLARKPSTLSVMTGTLLSAILFYLITNTVSFIADPLYAKTVEGFVQAQWTGPVGSPLPTWVFLRNGMLGNLLFTGLFLLSRKSFPQATPASSEALAR